MKKLILLPVMLLALAACTPGTSSEVSSSSEAASSSSSSEASSSSSSSISSSEFVADTKIWSIVGSFGTSNWANAGTDYDLTRVSEGVNQFEITLDLFVGEEFAIIHDRSWTGQLGYSSINVMDPADCMIEGGGYAVKNAQTAVAGNYHIVLDTTNAYLPHIAVTRLGDPLVVPTEEFWRLAGSFNAWTNPDDAYLLTETATKGTYEITLDLYVDVNFKVVKNGASWFGFDKLGTITPEGCMTDNGGNINVTVDGSYLIQVVSGDAIVVNVTRLGDPIVPPPAEVYWRLFGSFNSWLNPDDNFLMVETATAGTYEFTLDLYVANEFKVVKNESIYLGAGALGTVDPVACVGGTDNIVVAVDGSYKISVVDAETDVVNVTRLGDPIVPPVGEVDNGGWYLTGTINSWTITDATSYPLVAVEGQEHTYSGTFDFAFNAEFVVNAGGTWDLKRGPSKVAIDPLPAGIDLTGDNIKVTKAGSYKVTFVWATALGGSIIIEQLSVLTTVVPAANLLAAKVASDAVTVSEAYVFYNNSETSVAGVATALGTVNLNYFNSAADVKTAYTALVVGTYINVTGTVAVGTSGDCARAKTVLPTALEVVTAPSWTFGSFAVSKTIDMATTDFKTFADNLTINDIGVMYTFTNIKFMTVGTAAPTSANSNYDYLNYTALVAGMNNLQSSVNFYRLGFYKCTVTQTVDAQAINTADTYTVTSFFVGTNRDFPYVAGGNPILRLSGYYAVTKTSV